MFVCEDIHPISIYQARCLCMVEVDGIEFFPRFQLCYFVNGFSY